jgi:hypothetical protein
MMSRAQLSIPVSPPLWIAGVVTLAALSAMPGPLLLAQATSSQPEAVEVVRKAVDTEIRAGKTDHTMWKYRDRSVEAGTKKISTAVETPQGSLERTMELNGRPLTGDDEKKECERIRKLATDPAEQAKVRKNEMHDDQQAVTLLKMLPDAFLWTVTSRNADSVTLHYEPNPRFSPPSMEARVMSAMAGDIVVALPDYRIESLRGKLTHDVLFGYGILGKMNQGGTFDVERRMVAPGHWDITENHVHIGGRAMFKSINQNSDEVKTDWTPSTEPTLAAAAQELGVETASLQ